MRKFLPSLLFLFVAASALAQSADYNTPITRASVAKIKISTFAFSLDSANVNVGVIYQDASNNVLAGTGLQANFGIPSTTGVGGSPCTTTLNGLAGAMNSTRSGETGGAARIQQFRILGYLSDQSCLTGVTLVP